MKSFLFILSLFCSSLSFADETCIFNDNTTSGKSNTILNKNYDFGFINNEKLHFYQINIESSNSQNASFKACFDTNKLFIGINKFSAYFEIENPLNLSITGTTSLKFYLNKNTNQERILCEGILNNGNRFGTCSGEIKLTLRELNSNAADEIDGYRSRIATLKAQGERLNKEGFKQVEELEFKLDSMALLDPENLNSEDLVKIDSDLKEISEKLNSMQKSLDEMRVQYQKSLVENIDSMNRIKKNAIEILNNQNINVRDQSFYSQSVLSDIQIPSLQVSNTDSPSDFNEESNTYIEYQNRTLSLLSSYSLKQDSYNFNLTVKNWSDKINFFHQINITRGSLVTLKELNVFNNSIIKVRTFIESNSPKITNIPEDVRRNIDEDIKPYEPEKAEELKSALSNWKSGETTEKQKLVLDTIRAIGAGYQGLDTLEDDRVEAKLVLGRVLSQAIDVAKDISRLVVAFTPLNDFVDFCEIVTGRNFCLPDQRLLSTSERGFTAIGLFIGTGNFWRGIGEKITGGMRNVANLVTDEASLLVSTEKNTIKNINKTYRNQGLRLSSKQKKYIVKLLKSDGVYTEARISSILAKYAELERKIIKIKPKTVENLVVTRGKNIEYFPGVKDFTEIKRDMFKMDDYSLMGNGRWSIGGKRLMGNNAIYTVIGEGKQIEEVLTKEMRIGNISEAVTSTKAVNFKRVLDLSDKTVLDSLGVELSELLKPVVVQDAYDIPQAIGNLASEAGYDAIIAFSQQVKSKRILVILKEGL